MQLRWKAWEYEFEKLGIQIWIFKIESPSLNSQNLTAQQINVQNGILKTWILKLECSKSNSPNCSKLNSQKMEYQLWIPKIDLATLNSKNEILEIEFSILNSQNWFFKIEFSKLKTQMRIRKLGYSNLLLCVFTALLRLECPLSF